MIANGKRETVTDLLDFIDKTNFSAFGAETLDKFQEKVTKLSMYDLCDLGMKVGLRSDPSNRKRVESALVKEFIRAKATHDSRQPRNKVEETEEQKEKRVQNQKDLEEFLAFTRR